MRRFFRFLLEVLRYELAAQMHDYGAPPKPENMTTSQLVDALQSDEGGERRLRSIADELTRRRASFDA